MKKWEWKKMHCKTGGSAVYGLGLIGALVYFLQQANTLWEGVIGFIKALVWPAMLVYKLLEFLRV
jgi:hypothetical protein